MQHRVWRVGSDIDTDALAPGAYMKFELPEIARHCLENRYPGLAGSIKKGDVLVAGPNFGMGSSREQAVGVLVELGLAAVIAPSFSGLYFRNAFNLGLLAIVCPDAARIADASMIQIDTGRACIKTDADVLLQCQRIPQFLIDMAAVGGLLNQLKLKHSTQNV